jgi:2-polyprenyl-6-hydroxyphenyl methylase/3-demethylubiquinone-9 3-methyltransferase
MFGPWEACVANAYRAAFIDLTDLVDHIRNWSSARAILDLGCGEGAVTQELVRRFPDARVTGIDISPSVGRLYRGEPHRVTFQQDTIEHFAARNPGTFDLVVVCDVLHHIRPEQRADFLRGAAGALKPGGLLILKEWIRSATLIHLLCFLSDRFITGDRVHYYSRPELSELLKSTFGPGAIQAEAIVKPRSNNVAFCVQVGCAGGPPPLP